MNNTHYTIFTSDFSLVGEPASSAPSSPLASGYVSLATILSVGGGSLTRTQEGGASSRSGLGPGQMELQPVVGPATSVARPHVARRAAAPAAPAFLRVHVLLVLAWAS
jgi:hypothetical protein